MTDNTTKPSYDEQALRFLNPKRHERLGGQVIDVNHATLGITAELGELAEITKKSFVNNLNLPKEEVVKEVGDIIWYCALALRAVGSSIEEAQAVNLKKLETRYGSKFSEDKWKRENRDIKKEDTMAHTQRRDTLEK